MNRNNTKKKFPKKGEKNASSEKKEKGRQEKVAR